VHIFAAGAATNGRYFNYNLGSAFALYPTYLATNAVIESIYVFASVGPGVGETMTIEVRDGDSPIAGAAVTFSDTAATNLVGSLTGLSIPLPAGAALIGYADGSALVFPNIAITIGLRAQ
jgi:hypothetical protein